MSAETKRRKRKQLTPEQQQQREQLKAAKFRELGEFRVPRALARIRQVRNLFNRSSYSWTVAQAEKVVSALKEAVIEVDAYARDSAPEAQEAFTL